ncbi:hypothetical protein [Acidithiobacillus sulfuriphilus]|uniref:hypothetical protein n=1 Tax=Acidithiobacillus sulfuriphilus TaxID=1867749 RepID=UPI003F5E1D88
MTSTIFELFRYQLLPIDRYLQGNLLTGVATVEELIERKNEFFAEALSGTSSFSNKKHETVTKRLYERDGFFLFKIANNRSIHRETKEFKDEIIDNWPAILVGIWNRPDKQLIAVQRRTSAFSSSEVVVKLVLGRLSDQLGHHHLRAIHEPLFEKKQFWSILNQYQGKVKSVEFEIVTPNMANISGTLPEDLKEFAKQTNSTRNRLKIESDPEAPLHLEESNRVLQGLVNYSSEGGGNISVKIDGIKKKYQTSRTVKEVTLGEVEMQGGAEQIIQALRELLQ